MRQLATIQEIKEVLPIEGKDRIGLATFKDVGWKVIVNKEEISTGDRVVYFEVDSLLPLVEWNEFLKPKCWNEKLGKLRLRTMKMGNVYSEGLAIPVYKIRVPENKMFPNRESDGFMNLAHYRNGDDVTELLGITEYGAETERQDVEHSTKPRPVKNPILKFLMRSKFFRENIAKHLFWKKSENISGTWSKFIPVGKTDETRVQNLMYLFEEGSPIWGKELVATEKVDGSSLTLSYDARKNKLFVASRNNVFLNINEKNEWCDFVRDYNWDNIIKFVCMMNKFDKIVMQGELLGKPQGNYYNLKQNTVLWFNVWVEEKGEKHGKYLTPQGIHQLLKQVREHSIYVHLRNKVWSNREDWGNGYGSIDAIVADWRNGFHSVPIVNFLTVDPKIHTLEWFEKQSIGKSELINKPREGLVWRMQNVEDLQSAQERMANMFSFKVINKEFKLNGWN